MGGGRIISAENWNKYGISKRTFLNIFLGGRGQREETFEHIIILKNGVIRELGKVRTNSHGSEIIKLDSGVTKTYYIFI